MFLTPATNVPALQGLTNKTNNVCRVLALCASAAHPHKTVWPALRDTINILVEETAINASSMAALSALPLSVTSVPRATLWIRVETAKKPLAPIR